MKSRNRGALSDVVDASLNGSIWERGGAGVMGAFARRRAEVGARWV